MYLAYQICVTFNMYELSRQICNRMLIAISKHYVAQSKVKASSLLPQSSKSVNTLNI